MSRIVATVELDAPAGIKIPATARLGDLQLLDVTPGDPDGPGPITLRFGVLHEGGVETMSQVLALAYTAVARVPWINEVGSIRIEVSPTIAPPPRAVA